MAGFELRHLRDLSLSYPEVSERMSHGAPCFYILDRRPFVRFHDNHRNDGRRSFWCPVGQSLQEVLIFTQRETCFKPNTSSAGHFRNWVGVFLDANPSIEWSIVIDILNSSYKYTAPKSLIDQIDVKLGNQGD